MGFRLRNNQSEVVIRSETNRALKSTLEAKRGRGVRTYRSSLVLKRVPSPMMQGHLEASHSNSQDLFKVPGARDTQDKASQDRPNPPKGTPELGQG